MTIRWPVLGAVLAIAAAAAAQPASRLSPEVRKYVLVAEPGWR
jgi:hypothetical protein